MTSTTTRRELPGLFKPEMVQALLNTQLDTWPPEPIDPAKAYKGMTRRIIKPQPDGRGTRTTNVLFEDWHGRELKPKYQPGDLIYVRERWANILPFSPDTNGVIYHADKSAIEVAAHRVNGTKWKPSIHMPKEAARIWLECVDVKVERVQDISEEEAIWEGIRWPNGYSTEDDMPSYMFSLLWDSINAARGFGWNANPWVWVYSFKVISKTGRP